MSTLDYAHNSTAQDYVVELTVSGCLSRAEGNSPVGVVDDFRVEAMTAVPAVEPGHSIITMVCSGIPRDEP
jgi:hypothetical protein